MAIGDIKGDEVVTIVVTAGANITKGQVVHLETDDGYWDPVVDTDVGKFGVAIETFASGATGRIVIWGRVEVTATAAAIVKGARVMAGTTGLVAQDDFTGDGSDECVGTAMEAFGSSDSATIWVGLVN